MSVLLLSAPAVRPSLDQLAKIRGAMWSVRWAGRYGPRPGRPDNILAMDYYEHYTATERKEMLDRYTAEGYTHGVTGPMIDPGGYHGQFPGYPGPLTQVWWDFYLDCLEEWQTHTPPVWPIHFAHPDGWTYEQMEMLVPFYEQSRAQALLPIVVWTGWEPSGYEWPNSYWVQMLARGATVMPHALRLVHTVSDVDALVGGPDDPEVQEEHRTGTWARSWANVVPYIHGWLVQVGPYAWAPDDQRAAVTRAEFVKLWSHTRGSRSLWTRFHFGETGWPTSSAWGVGHPLRVYYGEGTAYESYWHNLPEPASRAWGDLVLEAGADGVLDGCTMRAV